MNFFHRRRRRRHRSDLSTPTHTDTARRTDAAPLNGLLLDGLLLDGLLLNDLLLDGLLAHSVRAGRLEHGLRGGRRCIGARNCRLNGGLNSSLCERLSSRGEEERLVGDGELADGCGGAGQGH